MKKRSTKPNLSESLKLSESYLQQPTSTPRFSVGEEHEQGGTRMGWYHELTFGKLGFILLVLLLLTSTSIANNITVSQTATLVEKDTSTHALKVKFDLSWENSWRTSSAPNNWDAAWVFIKYRVNGGDWKHATLDSTLANFSVTNNNGIATEFKPLNTGKGVFIYRANDGSGTNQWNGIKLPWKYGFDGVGDNDTIQVKVFAIEMCYVPQGSFYLGSGGSEIDHFYTYPTSTQTYQVTSENEIIVGTSTGNLYYTNISYGGDQQGPIPALYPKGYNSFYCMKYEISQEQYANFLNTLTATQKSTRYSNFFNNIRYYIKLINGIYGCDGNNNGILNESDDGQNIACNYLSWVDGCAYADWSGMRPMTELEFEKACRGTLTPVANEYAWGNTNIVQAIGITNPRQATEVTTPTNANCVYNNASGVQGPVRVGNFARSGSTRESSGASYYGIMELSGNLWERPVTAGNTTGRSFTGLLGDGTLDASGNSNVTNWPGIDAVGSGFRGGDWSDSSDYERVSDRLIAASVYSDRLDNIGFRCCVTP